MADQTPRMPNFWWCPTHHLYRGGAEHQPAQDSEPADAVVRDRLRRARVEREQLSNALAELEQLQARIDSALTELDREAPDDAPWARATITSLVERQSSRLDRVRAALQGDQEASRD